MVTQLKFGVQNGMTNGHKIESRVQNGMTKGHTNENRGSERDDEWSQN